MTKFASEIAQNDKDQGGFKNPETGKKYLETVVDCLIKKEISKETIDILKILLKWDDCAHYYELLAECHA